MSKPRFGLVCPPIPPEAREAILKSVKQARAKAKRKSRGSRLTKADYDLLYEALDMLATDYRHGHPEQERLEKLLVLTQQRGSK